VKISGSFGAGDFVGKWDRYRAAGRAKNYRWHAHANGRMEIVGKDWEATWRIIEDGTLLVIDRKKPYIYKRDGDDWVGINVNGKNIRLKRGTW
jgi:hypothetical protein